jgi:very-short-patch-repair endonuclease
MSMKLLATDQLALELFAAGLPEPERERKVTPGRRYAFDFSWPQQHLAVEVEGGTWSGGRHTRGNGYEEDCRKYNIAVIEGWKVLRFTSDMVKRGEAIKILRVVLKSDR